jgi:hypothetical protein
MSRDPKPESRTPIQPDRHDPSGPPQATPAETAEQTRMAQQGRPEGIPDRDEKLIHVGRGHQTAGRQGS